MAAVCPDNSTECLLRAILEANSGYNWDPLTFAFTAALSILGFVVASATLIQAALAAGPGRLKASEGIVGTTFHTTARTRFDWTELRFRTVVEVPEISIEQILSTPTSGSSKSDFSPRSLRRARYVAGWAQILEDIPALDEVSWTRRPVKTDYLPGDILAPPAWTTVMTLAILGMVLGCDNVQRDTDGFVTVGGNSIQIEFFPHQTLGRVAFYRNWHKSRDLPVTDLKTLQAMVESAIGRLKIGIDTVFSPSYKYRHTLRIQAIETLLRTHIPACQHDHDSCLTRKAQPGAEALEQEIDFTHKNFTRSVFAALLVANQPTVCPVFPIAYLNVWHIVATTFKLRSLQTGSANSDFITRLQLLMKDRLLIRPSRLDSVYEPTTIWSSWVSDMSEVSPIQRFPDSSAHDWVGTTQYSTPRTLWSEDVIEKMWLMRSRAGMQLQLSRNAVSSVLDWIEDKESLHANHTSKKRRLLAVLLQRQLAELDWWLSRQLRPDLACAFLNLMKICTSDGDLQKSTWTQIRAHNVLPQVLDKYHLSWEHNEQNPDYIVVKQEISQDLYDEMMVLSKRLTDSRMVAGHDVADQQPIDMSQNVTETTTNLSMERKPTRIKEYYGGRVFRSLKRESGFVRRSANPVLARPVGSGRQIEAQEEKEETIVLMGASEKSESKTQSLSSRSSSSSSSSNDNDNNNDTIPEVSTNLASILPKNDVPKLDQVNQWLNTLPDTVTENTASDTIDEKEAQTYKVKCTLSMPSPPSSDIVSIPSNERFQGIRPEAPSRVARSPDHHTKSDAEQGGRPKVLDPEMEIIEHLLMFRASLMATLLATGQDSSEILATPRRAQMVQMQ